MTGTPLANLTPSISSLTKPHAIAVWSDAAFELLHTLTQRVPLLSEAQAIHLLKRTGLQHAKAVSELQTLSAAGWLQRLRCTASWPTPPQAPRFCWSPGDVAPSFAQLRSAARRVSTTHGLRNVALYVASRWSANLFAAAYRGTLSTELVPSWIAWAQIYLRLLETSPDLAPHCDCRGIPAPGEGPRPMPDCLAIAPDGVTTQILASLNHSSIRGLQALHEMCLSQNLSYQLW